MALKRFKIPEIFIVLAFAFLLRLALSFFGTLRLDQGTFIAWSVDLAENGFKIFYNGWSDYLPGYLYILWFLGKVRGVIPDVLFYKLPGILSDIATGFLIYKVVQKIKNTKWGLAASALYLFNPAIFANSALWGQVDSLTALFCLLAIYLLPRAYLLSAVALAVGTLIKPQAAFVALVIIFLMLKNKFSFSKILNFGLLAFGVFILGFIPFQNQPNLINFTLGRILISINQYPYTSVNAFNFWGLFGFWKPDAVFTQTLGYALPLVLFIFLAIKLWKKEKLGYALAAVIFSSSFLFFTRMHERHLLPIFAPLAVVASENPFLWVPYSILSLVYTANLYYSFKWITYDFVSIFSPFVIKIFILLAIASLVLTLWGILTKKKLKIRWNLLGAKAVKEKRFPKINISTATTRYLLIAILAFSFFVRVFELGKPPNEYFDEVYHAFTARIILHGDPKAWEWWNPHPEGFAYEWTHPPLAKLGMVLGMKIFGENSFGWRIPGALLGVGAVFLVFGIAKHIFKDDLLAVFSAAIFSLDGLGLVMSRIGMNDSYLLFFALATVYCFLKEKDFLAAASFGLALSSKWSAIWVIPILFVLWLKRRNKFKPLTFVWFTLLPFTLYLLTYTPMFTTGHDLATWWGMQKQMWWYHTGLRADHPYTSPWWTWPLLVRPIYLYTSDEIGGMVSRIYAFGNPLIFWLGLFSILVSLIYAYREKNKKLGFVVFSYLVFFAPWAASPRIMFLYHYLPSIPFMCIATAYVLRRNPKLIVPLFAITFSLSAYFYSHWAGLQIPLWLDQSYYWFTSWR